jgi:hypothetical protein
MAVRPICRDSISGRARDCSFLQDVQTGTVCIHIPVQWVPVALFPAVKQLVLEADHSHLTDSE